MTYLAKTVYTIVLSLFLTPCLAYAAPTYGTNMPAKGRVSVGYQSNVIFKHDLADSYGNIKSAQYFFDISYGVYDWLTVEGKIGSGDITQKGGIHPKVNYNSGFAGGYGLRSRIAEDAKNRTRVVLGLHHISVHPANRIIDNDRYESLLDDWQCSLLTSKDIGIFSPFVGAKAGRCDLVYKVNKIDRKRRAPLYYGGLVAGCVARIWPDISITVEGHFIDESSLSAGVYYTF